MAGSDENNPGIIGQANFQGTWPTDINLNLIILRSKPQSGFFFLIFICDLEGGFRAGGGKFGLGGGHNRRALSSIDRNIIEAPTYPYAINKDFFSE